MKKQNGQVLKNLKNRQRTRRFRTYMEKGIMKKIYFIYFVAIIVIYATFSCGRKFAPSGIAVGKGKEYDSAAFDYIFVEAIKQKLMGNGGDALKYLEQCIKINPVSDAAYYQMAQIVMAGGDFTNGKKYIKKALDLDPGNIWYMMMIAGTYYKEENLDSAIYFYEKAVRNFPDKEELLLTLGDLYSENMKFDKASLIFEELDKKYGINEASTVANIKNMILAKKYSEAKERALLLLKEYPDEITYNGLLAEIYRGQGENQKAMDVYNKLIERSPDNPETQLSLCDFLINEKEYDELFILLNTVILNTKILKEDKIALIAKLIELPDLIEKSSEKLMISIMILEADYKENDIIKLLRPELLIKQKKLNDAALRLEEIIKINPDNYYAWEKLLIVYLQNHNYKKLEETGEECATRFNRSFLAKILYATGAAENKNYDVALEELRKANILAGDNKEMIMQILSIKADIYYRQKNYKKAFETFDEAIKTNNKDLTVLNNYAYYLAEQNIRLKEAENMARQVIETEKDNKTFLDTYGWVLYKRGKLREAQKIMESIVSDNEESDAEYYEHLGYIMKKRRNCEKAVQNWQNAIKMDSTKSNLIEEIRKCQGSH